MLPPAPCRFSIQLVLCRITSLQVATSHLGPLRFWARALLTTPCCYGCSEQASAAAAGARLVAWTSRSDSWNDTGASHVPRHVLRQASRTAVKDNQGRRQHVLPRRHGHDRTTSWPDSPRWLRPIRPAEYLYLSISVFPLETSIFLERSPLERERYKKKIAWSKDCLGIDRYFFWSLWPF